MNPSVRRRRATRTLVRSLACLTLVSLAYSLFVFNSRSPLANMAKDEWLPVSPQQLAQKDPMVEKDADAEAIFWDVRVNDDNADLILNHYVRIKIFTDRGRENHGKVDISYLNGTKIKDIAARTVKPDGTIIELDKKDIFERTIVKIGGIKLKAKSFALPGIEPGAIIEYRYREVREGASANNMRLDLQKDIPVQRMKYTIKPQGSEYTAAGMRFQTFHRADVTFNKEKDGYYSTTIDSVPAFREESQMPPEIQVRPWMLVFYSYFERIPPSVYWNFRGNELYEASKDLLKPNDEIKRAIPQIVGDAATEEAKVQRIYEWCQREIKNTSRMNLTFEERKKLKENKSPGDTFKARSGSSGDIDRLFGAMARAAGLEARIVQFASRESSVFEVTYANSYFLNAYAIAVRNGLSWRFYDPCSMPLGMMRWEGEGQLALVSDPGNSGFVKIPLSAPARSKQKRTARLRLSEDGTLEGDVKIEYTGHLDIKRKDNNDDDSPSEREEALRQEIKLQMSTAELSDIRVENVTEADKPFTYQFKVRVPGYAQRTGKRLFLQPAFFQHGLEAMFKASGRTHPIDFEHAWTEEDDVNIELPAGFTLEAGESPGDINAGKDASYTVKIGVTTDGKAVQYTRRLMFGGGGTIRFPVQSYASLQKLFNTIHERDNHTLTFRQKSAE